MAATVNAESLKERTKQFAIHTIRLCRALPKNSESTIISRQLMRSATSVGANYRAVCRARSGPDFISKLGVVLEEADESLFWIDLLVDAGVTSTDRTRALRAEANELVAIFVASLRTAKNSTKSEIKNLQSEIFNLKSAI
jgi:four helix bundle protein